MPNFEWITHRNTRILYMDIASQKTQDLRDIIARLTPVIEKEPANSILAVVNTTGGRFDKEVSQILKEFTEHNKPYMRMTAIVGVEGLQKVIYNAILMFTQRKNLILKKSREEALDWLAGV